MVLAHGQVVWRFFLDLPFISSISMLSWLPDTYHWCYAKGREAEGDSALQKPHDGTLSPEAK
jgi:hypothetical protein